MLYFGHNNKIKPKGVLCYEQIYFLANNPNCNTSEPPLVVRIHFVSNGFMLWLCFVPSFKCYTKFVKGYIS